MHGFSKAFIPCIIIALCVVVLNSISLSTTQRILHVQSFDSIPGAIPDGDPCRIDTVTLALWFEGSDIYYYGCGFFRPPYFIFGDSLPSNDTYRRGILYYPTLSSWDSDIREQLEPFRQRCGIDLRRDTNAWMTRKWIDTVATLEAIVFFDMFRNNQLEELGCSFKKVEATITTRYVGRIEASWRCMGDSAYSGVCTGKLFRRERVPFYFIEDIINIKPVLQ
jgi:hypothetical protein